MGGMEAPKQPQERLDPELARLINAAADGDLMAMAQLRQPKYQSHPAVQIAIAAGLKVIADREQKHQETLQSKAREVSVASDVTYLDLSKNTNKDVIVRLEPAPPGASQNEIKPLIIQGNPNLPPSQNGGQKTRTTAHLDSANIEASGRPEIEVRDANVEISGAQQQKPEVQIESGRVRVKVNGTTVVAPEVTYYNIEGNPIHISAFENPSPHANQTFFGGPSEEESVNKEKVKALRNALGENLGKFDFKKAKDLPMDVNGDGAADRADYDIAVRELGLNWQDADRLARIMRAGGVVLPERVATTANIDKADLTEAQTLAFQTLAKAIDANKDSSLDVAEIKKYGESLAGSELTAARISADYNRDGKEDIQDLELAAKTLGLEGEALAAFAEAMEKAGAKGIYESGGSKASPSSEGLDHASVRPSSGMKANNKKQGPSIGNG